jgi:hypothetical protein
MTDSSRAAPEDPNSVRVALCELIEALDRRVPDAERAGEGEIREQATELRAQATQRIEALADADAKAGRLRPGSCRSHTRTEETIDGSS